MNQKVADALEKYGGNLSLKDARKEGILPMTLDRLVKSKQIEKVAPGFYAMKDTFIDELYLAQSVYSKGVFSHETALDIYQVGTYIPKKLNMTFPKGYNVPKDRLEKYAIQPHYTTKETF